MIVRCKACSRLFRQVLAAQKDCPRCEREPVRPFVEVGWRTCVAPGCGAEFRLEVKRGRPPLKCPKHRKGAA